MKELNMNYEINLHEWNVAKNDLLSGKADLLMGMNYSNSRAKTFLFGPTHNYILQSIIYRKGSPYSSSVMLLKGKNVVVEKGSFGNEYIASELKGIKIIPYVNITEGLHRLSEGNYDVAFLDSEAARYIIRRDHLTNLEVSIADIPPQDYRFVGSNELLLNQINDALYKLKKDGTYDKIHSKWFSDNKSAHNSVVIYIILAFFVILAAALYFLNQMLRSKISKANKLLEKKNRRLALAIHAGGIFVWRYDVATETFSNLEDEFLPQEGIKLEKALETVHPDDLEYYKRLFTNLLNGVVPKKPIVIRHKMKSSTWQYYEKEFSVILDSDNKVSTIIGSLRNVTREKSTQQSINELLSKYHTIFTSTSVGLQYYDKDGIMVEVNDASNKIFGIPSGNELIAAHISIYDDPYLKKYVQRGKKIEPFHGIIETDFDLFRKFDGIFGTKQKGIRSIDTRINPIYDSDDNLKCIIVTSNDVTDILQMQKLLEESVRKQAFAIKSANLTFWEYDCATRTLKCYNEPMANYDDSVQISPQTYFGNIHPDDIPKLKKFGEIMLNGRDENFKIEARLKIPQNKEWRYCSASGTPFERDPKTGRVTRYVGIRRDNTELVELAKKNQVYATRLDYVLKSSKIRVWDYTVSSHMITIYTGANDIVETITKDDFLKRIGPGQNKEMADMMERVELGNDSPATLLCEWHQQDNPDETFYYLYNGIPIKNHDGQITNVFGLRRDVTDLIKAQKNLEKEKEKAQQADKLKSAFLANMSHEIRTPLNAIVGFSNLMEDADEDERKEYVKIINTNNELLLRLISDILDLAKIESGVIQLEFTEFDLALFFNELYSGLRQRERRPGVELLCENPFKKCIVCTDRNRLAQLITNFTTNAIKYTPSGHIRMGYGCIDNGIHVYVEDTGIGIPKEKQNRIFHRFEKLDDFAQGTGLGLSICKAITDTLGGRIGFDSTAGKGSVFWAWIPSKKDISHI
jgi:signal transduction histidine kinase